MNEIIFNNHSTRCDIFRGKVDRHFVNKKYLIISDVCDTVAEGQSTFNFARHILRTRPLLLRSYNLALLVQKLIGKLGFRNVAHDMGIALSILVYRMHTKHVLLEESEKYWLKIVKKRPIYNFIKRLEQGGCNVIFISAALEPAVNGLTSSISSHLISSQVLYNANGYAAGLGVDLLNRKVETLNERFPGVFKGRVLGISDNVQDLPMLRQCTIGIYLDRNISKAIRESRLIRIPYQENCYD